LAFNLWFNRIRNSPYCSHERREGFAARLAGVVLALTKTQLSNQSDAGDQPPAPRHVAPGFYCCGLRRRRFRNSVRLLYGICCGQRGGRGRFRVCCCWSSNRRGSETPQPRHQVASPGFTVGALFATVIWPFHPRLHRLSDSHGGSGGTRDRSPAHRRGGPPRCPRQQSPERVVRLRGSGR
jgi:hypothetical protein